MKLGYFKTTWDDIRAFRNLFLREINCQFIHNSYHERGWANSYMLSVDDLNVGYASIHKREEEKGLIVFEFYILPHYRRFSSRIFAGLVTYSGATHIDCQSNDHLLSAMLFEFSQNINSEIVLFEDGMITEHFIPGVLFRHKTATDITFQHYSEPDGDYVLEWDGKIVATGGFLLHYNIPFADLYMEVNENYRKKGLGSFLIQELKKVCLLAGRVPAARCNIENKASKATLIKGGLKVVGYGLNGDINFSKV